jgi:hypothetical protein
MSTVFEELESEGVASSGVNDGPDVQDDIAAKSMVRWFFNPAARIMVRDRVVGNEINAEGRSVARQFIKAGVLVPLRNVTYNVPRPKDQPPPPGRPAAEQRLIGKTKYASDIATELADAYADTGALVIDSLTGIEDEKLVSAIYKLCMGARIRVASDPLLVGEKVPVIPTMIDHLTSQAPQNIEKAFADGKDPQLKAKVEETRRLLLASCSAAQTGWARFITSQSRKSKADRSGGHPGKSEFDARDRRAFAAMGELIPTDIQATNPTLEKAVEILLKRELNEPQEDPRIAQLLAVVESQAEEVKRLTATVGEIQAARKPGPKPKTEIVSAGT